MTMTTEMRQRFLSQMYLEITKDAHKLLLPKQIDQLSYSRFGTWMSVFQKPAKEVLQEAAENYMV
ncbi:15817_t:CDS:2 [Entrophospora sp. SA101]|nr:15817_t:CDS:2 [Entrophospora sp. SA101]CAJ0846423.1 8186_t:CDS:2 [Entrophospora sp. SA101]